MVNPLEKLCVHDQRSPYYFDDPEDNIKPRDNCYCDNCFYGRDEMALQIIANNELLKRAADKLQDYVEGDLNDSLAMEIYDYLKESP